MNPSPISQTIPPGAVPAPSPHSSTSPRGALAGLALAMFVSSFGAGIAGLALPKLSGVFHAPFDEVQWVALAYSLTVTVLAVAAGRLGDSFGKKPLLMTGSVMFVTASLLCGLAPSLSWLIGFRFLQGAGAALMMTLSVAAASELSGGTQTGKNMGLMGMASAAGMSLGPALGGFVLPATGWRGLFFLGSLPGIAAAFLLARHLPSRFRRQDRTRSGIAAGQMLLLSLTLFSGVMAIQGKDYFPSGQCVLAATAILGLVSLAVALRKSSAPLIDFRLLRNSGRSMPLALSMLITGVMTAPLVAAPFYMITGLRIDPGSAGIVLSIGPVVTALAGLPAGAWIDRSSAGRVAAAGLIVLTLGCGLLAFLPAGCGVGGYVAAVVLLNSGYAAFQAANTTTIMAGTSAETRGVTSGLLSLSRNLGMVAGMASFGAIFGSRANLSPDPEAAVQGAHLTFTSAAGIALGALTLFHAGHLRRVFQRLALVLVIQIVSPVLLQASAPGTLTAPYPLIAAGWSPEAGNGLYYSRWAENWQERSEAGPVPDFKAMALPGGVSLSLSTEIRLRYEAAGNALPLHGTGFENELVRGVAGADLQWNAHVRLYAELATGQAAASNAGTSASMENDASLQQLFLDLRWAPGDPGSTLAGMMAGRQEFTDGPRQLISFSDGPNIHRTWNGVRLYWHEESYRLGAFSFRASEPGQGLFDDGVSAGERLSGLNASIRLAKGTFLDPFWFHTEMPGFRSGPVKGPDHRDTLGLRLWGSNERFKFDLTAAAQNGGFMNRPVSAWGVFAGGSVLLSSHGWKPRLTAHLDIASGGGSYGRGTMHGFNPLYSSSNYLSEGRFLSLSNLLLAAGGVSATPSKSVRLSAEAGLARRMASGDAVYAGGMRPYPGTQSVPGRDAGVLLRLAGAWDVSRNLTVSAGYDHFFAGAILRQADLPSGRFGFVSVTYRY